MARISDPALDVTPAWGTLYALALVRVVVTAFVLMSAFILDLPIVSAEGVLAGRALVILTTYFFLAVAMSVAVAHIPRRFGLQLAVQLAVDLIISTLLVALGGGMRSEFVVFYLFPVAAASLMLPTSGAFFVASLAVLFLLADSALRGLQGDHGDSRLFQAGLFGASLFGLTGLLRMLSARLDLQARLARSRGEDLRSQAQINRMVIAQMEQGVLVLDALGSIKAGNQAATLLLGLAPGDPLIGRVLGTLPGASGLQEEFERWRSQDARLFGWMDRTINWRGVVEHTAGQGVPTLRVRFVHPRTDDPGEFLLFMEDQRRIEQQAQQLKLAAMGRLTASIAHEIRNPLAAISNAGQLLSELPGDDLQQRLVKMIRDNTARLDRLVDDVLRVARREPPLDDEFLLGAFISGWLDEFLRARALPRDAVQLRTCNPDPAVKFEQGHLRQVIFNLLDNALRYGTGAPGGVVLLVVPAGVQESEHGVAAPSLWVFDDGKGVAREVQDAIFEPFYTTHSRGTGLGLFLAREFCLANHASLGYESFNGEGFALEQSGFVIRFTPGQAGDARTSRADGYSADKEQTS